MENITASNSIQCIYICEGTWETLKVRLNEALGNLNYL